MSEENGLVVYGEKGRGGPLVPSRGGDSPLTVAPSSDGKSRALVTKGNGSGSTVAPSPDRQRSPAVAKQNYGRPNGSFWNIFRIKNPSTPTVDLSKLKFPDSATSRNESSVPAEPFKFKQALALLGLFVISTAGLGLVNPWLMGVPILVVADYLAVFKSDLGWSGWGLGFIVLLNILPAAFIINGVTYDPSSTARQTPPPIVEQSDTKPASTGFTSTQPSECVTVPFNSTAADPVAEAKASAAIRLGKTPNLLAVENLQQTPDGKTIDVCK